MRILLLVVATAWVFLFLSACGESGAVTDQSSAIRGLRAYVVEERAQHVIRSYPSVIRPHDETDLAFEVGGQLRAVDLDVGQAVRKDEVLLSLNPSTFDLRVKEEQAVLEQALAQHRNADANYQRISALWDSRVIPRSTYDDAEALLATTSAQIDQAQRRVELAEENLRKTNLTAPFDGIVTSVAVDSFATVSPGEVTLSLYVANVFETAFSVPSTVINSLALDQQVLVVPTSQAGSQLRGRISELGSQAPDVSAFPVVVRLEEHTDQLKAGMSAQVLVEVALAQQDQGFLVPINCFILDALDPSVLDDFNARVFVFDAGEERVYQREVQVSEFRGNLAVVSRGLRAGEIIAAAGVSYLREGQRVRLLNEDQ